VLRGWSHVVAAFIAAGFTLALVLRCLDDGPRLSTMLLYGLASVSLFACSALYHIVPWTPSRRRFWRALDHGNIYVVNAATATAVGANVLDGWERSVLVASVWIIAGIGIPVAMFHVRLGAARRVGLYVAAGLACIPEIPGLVAALPAPAVFGLVSGGVLYGLGGAIYALKRPNPSPRLFGYHEIFHLLVIAGWLAFAAVIWWWVVPFDSR
jgi:hemolysin III